MNRMRILSATFALITVVGAAILTAGSAQAFDQVCQDSACWGDGCATYAGATCNNPGNGYCASSKCDKPNPT